jgi:peptidyl-prolyl cis-trans isomerase C
VVIVGGKPYSAKEMDELMKLLPPAGRSAMAKDPATGLTQLFMIVNLSDEARKRKLDQESPHKEMLERLSREITANAVVSERMSAYTVAPADQDAYYKKHEDQYEVAKVSAIKVAFSPNPRPGPDGKAPRSEDEAKARAEELAKQLKGGADFAELARANSDDKDSASKGGEYAAVHKSDTKFSGPVKTAVFNLKDGEISEPLRQPGGYYIFKMTAKTLQPMAEVSPTILAALKQEHFNQWISGLQTKYRPKIERPDYFKK